MATTGQQETETTKRVVVAMDFGTTYSGYAYSHRSRPGEVIINKAWAPGCNKLMSHKTPTCLLLNSKQEFDSFGYEAENKYADLAEEDKHRSWYFFTRFKMMLHTTSDLSEMTLLSDMEGKKLPAVDIFAHSIRYLKEHCQTELKNSTGISLDSDIQYVLTVPALWDDKAKIFMRKAAVKAGIPSEDMRLALEPEAASLWCQVYAEEKHVDICKDFIVVDLGGGTADITIQERNENNTLRVVHKATGGAWGGTNLDDNFENLLSKVFGKNALKELIAVDMEAYLRILRSFETEKRNLQASRGITVLIPVKLLDIVKKSGRDIGNQLEHCTVNGDKLKVKMIRVRELFQDPINSLIRHLKVLFRESKVQDAGTILLVGGFAESPIVQGAIREAFTMKTVIIPSECGLAVLKGAVRFGHFPMLIAARKSRYSYGVECKADFDPTKHPENRKFAQFGRTLCIVFKEIVAIGEELPIGKEISFKGHAVDAAQVYAGINVYVSNHANTMFTDEEGCVKIGETSIDFSHSDNVNDMECTSYVSFWDTEIKFRVEVKNSDKVNEKVFDRL